jgi:ABC-2 type transport system ATP-binding protein
MIVAENLSKRFGDFLAVDRVDFQVRAGEVLALLGPNGAGKTTTIRMLTAILRPTAGKASLAGYDVVEQPDQVRASVGVLNEQHGLYGRMTAQEYLDFFGQIYRLDAGRRKERIRVLLESFGLYEHRQRRIGQFSKGMRQKLALARTLLHEPPVLILDEPTSAMDPESASLVRRSIRSLRSAERSIIICTHNLGEAEDLADQIAIVRDGRIIAKGTPSELKLALLGPAEFEITLSKQLQEPLPALPKGARLTSYSPHWLRYQTADPARINSLVIQALLEQGFPVVTLREVPRSLEQVYFQAVSSPHGLEM